MTHFEAGFSKIKHLLRLAVPQLLTCCLVFLSLIKIPLFENGMKPFLVLAAIYYWAIYRPTLVPPSLCFFVGLFIDILSGFPLGLNAFCYVTAQWVVRDQRRFLMGQTYPMIWAGFGIVVSAVALLQWAVFAFIHAQPSPLFPVGISVLFSLLLFPAISMLFVLVHRYLPVASKGFP